MYEILGIDKRVEDLGEKALQACAEAFRRADTVAEHCQLKVLQAMRESRVSESCLNTSTGYGYNDRGRDGLEEVYARVFKAEDALVRAQIVCGTHALAVAISSQVRPGDEILSVTGRPYDTLEEVIGIRPSIGSLAEMGVTYSEVGFCYT